MPKSKYRAKSRSGIDTERPFVIYSLLNINMIQTGRAKYV